MKKERRRAVHCELIEPSKTSPGYFKYQITIREIDGSESIVPAYGKDMQDAIERLIWNERIEAVSDKKATFPIITGLIIAFVAIMGILSAAHNTPAWILGGVGCAIILGIIINRIESYLKK